MSIKYLVGLFGMILMVNSCVCKTKKSEVSGNVEMKEITKIIPKSRNVELNYSYKLTQECSRQAKLNIIENGFDSLFIRIWYNLRNTAKVLDLKNDHAGWKGELHTITVEKNLDSVRVLKATNKKVSPKSGWTDVINNLFLLGIITLPDFSELEEYNIPMDGSFLIVEVATITSYRIYTYGIPYEPTGIKEVSNIMHIMKLIENEFGILSLDKHYFQ